MRPRRQRFSICLVTILLCTGFGRAADIDSAKHSFEQKDYPTALKELTPLAKQGNAEAEVVLGRMYLMGFGVLKDPDEADKLFKAAAAQGNADAEFFLGAPSVLRHQNIPQGLKLLRLSAEQGNQDAQFLLGKTYLDGLGSDLPRDAVQADMWLRLAADHNLPFYQNELSTAERQMSASDIAKGKTLAAAWKPKRGLRPEDVATDEKPKS